MLEIHLEASAFSLACLIRKAASVVSYGGGSGSQGGPVCSEFMGSGNSGCRKGMWVGDDEILEVTRESGRGSNGAGGIIWS